MERYVGQKLLHKIILGLAAAFVALFIVHQIQMSFQNKRELDHSADRQKAFYTIVDLIETKPADAARNNEIAQQAALLGERVNVIVTDVDNKILYSLNRDFMREGEETFTVGRAMEGDDRVRIAKPVDGPMKQVPALKELPGGFFTKSKVDMVQLHSEYLASKKWNLYVMAAGSGYRNPVFESIVRGAEWICLFLFWMLLPIWVYRDAERRYEKPALWSLLVLITNVFGLVAYMALRQKRLTCRNCDEPILPTYSACPNCGTACRHHCPECGKGVDPHWSYCAHCSRPLPQELPIPD